MACAHELDPALGRELASWRRSGWRIRCKTWHSTCRTVSDQIETDDLSQDPSAGRAALEPGAFGAQLRGLTAARRRGEGRGAVKAGTCPSQPVVVAPGPALSVRSNPDFYICPVLVRKQTPLASSRDRRLCAHSGRPGTASTSLEADLTAVGAGADLRHRRRIAPGAARLPPRLQRDLADRAARVQATRCHPQRAASTGGPGRLGFNTMSHHPRAVHKAAAETNPCRTLQEQGGRR